MSVVILQGDARNLPLADESADVILCSPPYHGLRDYRDAGNSLEGQIGAEATPREYLDTLVACTREWIRVLRPTGSIFVNLGDRYSNRTATRRSSHQDGLFPDRPDLVKDWKRDRAAGLARMTHENVITEDGAFVAEKSLMGLPWRYAIRCTDELGLMLRAEIVWHKTSGLPESVRDRVTRAHEQVFHLTKERRYYHGTDLIREDHAPQSVARTGRRYIAGDRFSVGAPQTLDPAAYCHPVGKMPRSVWGIPTQPLVVPPAVAHARCCAGAPRPGCEEGLAHHAAWPPALVRRIILGWSPNGICLECKEGRWPVAVPTGDLGRHPGGGGSYRAMKQPGEKDTNLADAALRMRRVVGYACACTPYEDHPERRKGSVTPSRELRQDQDARLEQGLRRHHGDDWPERLPVREYLLDEWVPPPTRPAVVLDPFAGTGTSGLVADVLGRAAVLVELSADYCGLARWRTSDPGERARALGVAKPSPVSDDQLELFGEVG